MISIDQFVERLCRLGADRGPRSFPRRRRDREIMMKSIRMCLAPDREYSEPEINYALREWNRTIAPAIETDHVTLRRTLIDYGELERTADGAMYRIAFPAGAVAFDLEVDELDQAATIAAYLDYQQRRPRRPPAGGKGDSQA